jgi:chromosome segregation ATPase
MEASLQEKDEAIARLKDVIAKMSLDFAFIHDHVGQIGLEKNDQLGLMAEESGQSIHRCDRCVLLERRMKQMETELETHRVRMGSSGGSQTEQNDQLRKRSILYENDLKESRRQLSESDRKIHALLESEQRSKALIEQLRNEATTIRNELGRRVTTNQTLVTRIEDASKRIHELEFQLQVSHEEQGMIRNELTDPTTSGLALERLEQEVQLKTRESGAYEKLLAETQKQLTALTQKTIPRFKAKIALMERDKDETVKKLKQLSHLGLRLERSMSEKGEIPEAVSFFGALHQIQDDCVKSQTVIDSISQRKPSESLAISGSARNLSEFSADF